VRALHVFPIYTDQPSGGSDYYQSMLTRELAERGVEIDVFATCARTVRHSAAFGLDWLADFPPGPAIAGGIAVRRFPASYRLPPNLGAAISRLILRRWDREEAKLGAAPADSDAAVEACWRRALTRPAIYDYLALLGRGPISLGLIRAAVRAIRSYDIVLVGFMPFATLWYTSLIARRAGKPIVVLPLFHPEDVYHHFRLFYRCFERADALLAQTPYSTALFHRLFPKSHPVQIGVGVDAAELGGAGISGERFRSEHGLRGKKLVLFVGRKERHKRYDLAVEAVDAIGDPDVLLVMVGRDIDRLPITSPRVRFLGPLERPALLDAYDACDVFVLPSEHESFGIVFLEAWMRRKPVIGNAACRPVASVIEHGVDGFLCGGAADLAARIRQLLDRPAEARALGEAGQRKAVGSHTWHAVGGRVHDVYAALLAARRPCHG
jgi:glycosyltransferase involved in cell wall biosynthesis